MLGKVLVFPVTSWCLCSTLRPSLISSPLCMEPFAPEQATPIDLKISIRKKTRTTKINRVWGKKEKKDVKQQLRAMMGGQVLCQLCYGWQTLKCLIQSGGRGGKNPAAIQCGNQPLFEPWEKSHVVVIFILK